MVKGEEDKKGKGRGEQGRGRASGERQQGEGEGQRKKGEKNGRGRRKEGMGQLQTKNTNREKGRGEQREGGKEWEGERREGAGRRGGGQQQQQTGRQVAGERGRQRGAGGGRVCVCVGGGGGGGQRRRVRKRKKKGRKKTKKNGRTCQQADGHLGRTVDGVSDGDGDGGGGGEGLGPHVRRLHDDVVALLVAVLDVPGHRQGPAHRVYGEHGQHAPSLLGTETVPHSPVLVRISVRGGNRDQNVALHDVLVHCHGVGRLCEFGLVVVLVSDGDVDEQSALKRRGSAVSSDEVQLVTLLALMVQLVSLHLQQQVGTPGRKQKTEGTSGRNEFVFLQPVLWSHVEVLSRHEREGGRNADGL